MEVFLLLERRDGGAFHKAETLSVTNATEFSDQYTLRVEMLPELVVK